MGYLPWMSLEFGTVLINELAERAVRSVLHEIIEEVRRPHALANAVPVDLENVRRSCVGESLVKIVLSWAHYPEVLNIQAGFIACDLHSDLLGEQSVT